MSDDYTRKRNKEAIKELVEIANTGVLSEQETKLITLCQESDLFLSAMFNIIGNICRTNPDFKAVFVSNVLLNGEHLPFIEVPDEVKKN